MRTTASTTEKVIERKFCTKCNREVPKIDICVNQIILIDGDRVVTIYEKFLHRDCGGAIQPLKLTYHIPE